MIAFGAADRTASASQQECSPGMTKPESDVASLSQDEPMCDFKELWVDVGKRLWVPSFDELLRLADGKDPADEKDPKSGSSGMAQLGWLKCNGSMSM